MNTTNPLGSHDIVLGAGGFDADQGAPRFYEDRGLVVFACVALSRRSGRPTGQASTSAGWPRYRNIATNRRRWRYPAVVHALNRGVA